MFILILAVITLFWPKVGLVLWVLLGLLGAAVVMSRANEGFR
ncbi:MAG: hypothetical protein Athens071424_175 [Parcubacteria group bacterium Athens0714_24]|nr:MAG: hypothetical protein Athens071424_175 [Parcubacteria group bacterium Athens0714_24]